MTPASARTVALALLLAALAIPASAGPEQRFQRELHGIKGATDHRVTVVAAEFPWSAIGRLNNGQGAHCSAVLVGRQLVATAAHCLWNPRTQRPMPASAFTFVAAFDRGKYLKASKLAAVHPAPGWVFRPGMHGVASRADDWALLELAEPLGDDVGWLALDGGADSGMAVAIVGYGKDKAFVPVAHIGCHLTERRPDLVFFHDCDAVQGESGGPVLGWRDGQVRVVGLNVAVIVDRGDMGVAVGADGFRLQADRLGAAASSRPGRLSLPASLDLGGALGRP
jgi:protease YdgD